MARPEQKMPDFQKQIMKLKELDSKFTEFVETNSKNEQRITELEQTNVKLEECLFNLQKQKSALKEELIHWQKKLEALKQNQIPHNDSYKLKTLCALFDFSVSEDWDGEMQIITCHFSEDFYVQFAISNNGAKDLLAITPEHPNFGLLKEFLKETQDTRGFLLTLKKYFKCLETAERTKLLN